MKQSPRGPEIIWNTKFATATRVVQELRHRLGDDLRAAGLRGSIARGTAERYSDIDFLLIVKKPTSRASGLRNGHVSLLDRISDNTYCSFNVETWRSAIDQVTRPDSELPELLGGFTKILAVYDPERLFPRLEARARRVPASVFARSAEKALLHSYEDFCRVKNAYLIRDEVVLRDNVLGVTHSAALVVASINRTPFVSDREIFRAHRKFRKLPRSYDRIELLRYGNLKGRQLFKTLLDFYCNVVAFAAEEGVRLPVSEEALREAVT